MGNWMPWLAPIGREKTTRSEANYATATEDAADHRPLDEPARLPERGRRGADPVPVDPG